MDTSNLIILGTSHISKESANAVKKFINEEKPSIICLELDKQRYFSLKNPHKEKIKFIHIRKIGFKGWVFMVLAAWAEKKLGKMVGTTPGEEMLSAIKEAEKNHLRIELVDQDIEVTLKKFSKAITWKEKFRFVFDLVASPFKAKKKFDLRKVPEKKLVKELTEEVRKNYPNIYKVLVEERNLIIARNISRILKKFPKQKVFAVLGAGHEDEVLGMIKKRFE